MKKILIGLNFLMVGLILFKLFDVNATEKKYKVYIDAGHGGFDAGAVYEDIYEKDLALSISKMLRDLLENTNIEVEMTRETDIDLSDENSDNKKVQDIRRRTEKLNNSKADLYVSIHINSETVESYHGAQTFYSPKYEGNKILADDIQDSLAEILKNTTRKSKEISNVYLVKNASIVGCLVECGFISNEKERNLMSTKPYQEKISNAIYLGILKYLGL